MMMMMIMLMVLMLLLLLQVMMMNIMMMIMCGAQLSMLLKAATAALKHVRVSQTLRMQRTYSQSYLLSDVCDVNTFEDAHVAQERKAAAITAPTNDMTGCAAAGDQTAICQSQAPKTAKSERQNANRKTRIANLRQGSWGHMNGQR
jgi:hypothetical protein